MTRKLSQFKSLIPFVALPLFWGCSEDPLGLPPPPPDPPVFVDVDEPQLVITPDDVDLEVGNYLDLHLFWKDGKDTYDGPGTVEWTSGDPAIAQVSEDGRVQALAEGTVKIRAEGRGGTVEAVLRIRQS